MSSDVEGLNLEPSKVTRWPELVHVNVLTLHIYATSVMSRSSVEQLFDPWQVDRRSCIVEREPGPQ
jgi:hypothetical protein